jgi:hypothetical protein
VASSSGRAVVNPAPVVNSGRAAALARRESQVKGGGSSAKTQPTRQPRRRAEAIEPIAQTASVVSEPETSFEPVARSGERAKVKALPACAMPGTVMPKGRLVARAHRDAQCGGAAKLKAVKSSSMSSAATTARMANPEASGRDIARQVRAERCTQGKVACTSASRPTGRVSKKSVSNSPEKVGFAQTGYDQVVSGTMVSNTDAMTGSERGSCRVISGTEYTGPDDYQAKCNIKPEANPRKVAVTSTVRGSMISGTEVGHALKVTGTEAGGCRGVTGTEYLPADQAEAFCGTKPTAGPVKVSYSKTTKNQVVSGPSIQPREGMTGLEVGATRAITGSQYTAAIAPMGKKPTREMRGSIMSVPSVQAKPTEPEVASQGSRVSGTNVNFIKPVTGDEAGFCKTVTGNMYQSLEARQVRCGDRPPVAAEKVVQSSTFAGQKITGDRAGVGGKITGAEAGRCKSVTGSPYMSLDEVQTCGLPVERLKPDAFRKPGFSVRPTTGDQPGPLGITGANTGACQVVSGTPYQGADQTSAFCMSGMAAVQGESDYPVMINQYAGGPSILQPMHQTPAFTMQMVDAPVAPISAPAEEAAKASKITGDGGDDGFSITGDSWSRNSKVSGVDGRWAKSRNVSMQGNSVAMNSGAREFRPKMEPKVPASPVTGSSGNTDKGANVTVSGGARA